MKKVLGTLMIAVCMCMAMPAQAQLSFGVKGGVNLSKASFSDLKSNVKLDNFTGFFIGPMVEFTVPVIGIGVDGAVMFAQRGAKIGDATVKQNGIDVPINLKYTIGLGSMLGVYVAAGPDFYFNFAKNETIEGEELSKKKAVVGLNLGLGVKLLNHLQVGANYNIPLSNTAKVDEVGQAISYKTKMWQISLAYIF